MRDRPNDEAMIELLQKRPGVAAELFKIAIKENSPEELKDTMHLISAAGYDVSVIVKPKPEPRKQAKAIAPPSTSKGGCDLLTDCRHSGAALFSPLNFCPSAGGSFFP